MLQRGIRRFVGTLQIDSALQRLVDRGVEIVDPRQTYVGSEVDPARIMKGVRLHPQSRVYGARTYLGEGAEIGAQGPATVKNAVFGAGAVIDSGYVEGAVLLEGARLGFGAHVRPGTLLEEQASTAHTVGLKHTVLLSFVTLGSLINFCDCLMAGGTSRSDHSEVGSGFIHFNYTPAGTRGDKATPSLLGDVARGVFLRERRIFVGGSAGLVGPGKVGFGAVTGAGQVVRRPVDDGTLSVQPSRAVNKPFDPHLSAGLGAKVQANVEYIGQLVALHRFYRDVRGPRSKAPEVIAAALETLELCIAERCKRLESFVVDRSRPMPALRLDVERPCPLPIDADAQSPHVEWVQALDAATVQEGIAWLQAIADDVGGASQ